MNAKDVLLARKLGGGGGTITDGIVVKARSANGLPTEIDLYITDGVIQPYTFGTGNIAAKSGMGNAVRVDCKSPIIIVGDYAFYPSNIEELTNIGSIVSVGKSGFRVSGFRQLELNNLSEAGEYAFASMPNLLSFSSSSLRSTTNRGFLAQCKHLESVYLPKVTTMTSDGSNVEFGNCTALKDVQIGSVGYGITKASKAFNGCTQTGLTIIAYCKGSYADTVLTNFRNGATNATIIIKDDTTGETIVTSTP